MSKQQNILPSAPEIEKVILGEMLIDPDASKKALSLLKPEYFTDKCCFLTFKAMQQLDKVDSPVDLTLLYEKLKDVNLPGVQNKALYLSELTNGISSAALINEHCLVIIQYWLKRSVITSTKKVMESAARNDTDVFDVIEDAEKALKDIRNEVMDRVEKGSPGVDLTRKSRKGQVHHLAQEIKEIYGIDYEPKGNIKYKTEKVKDFLNEHFKFRYNKISNLIEFHNGTDDTFTWFQDRDFNNIRNKLKLANIAVTKDDLRGLIGSEYISVNYNPVGEYLDGLPRWDGKTDHIAHYLQQILLPDESKRHEFIETFRKWFVALVGSLVDDRTYNQTCFILVGKQGRFKTTFLNNLVPKHLQLEFLYSSRFNFENKDHYFYLATKMLINLDELASFAKTEIGMLKAVLTDPKVTGRRAWGVYDTHLWRRASFCGSTNDPRFLTDDTGTRRFLCFNIDDIVLDESLSVDLIYSQALHLYKNPPKDFTFWFDREKNDLIEERNRDFFDVSLEEELIIRYLTPPIEQDLKLNAIDYMQAGDINVFLAAKSNRINVNETTKRRLGKVMAKLNFRQVKKRVKGYKYPADFWIVKKVDNLTFIDEKGNESAREDFPF